VLAPFEPFEPAAAPPRSAVQAIIAHRVGSHLLIARGLIGVFHKVSLSTRNASGMSFRSGSTIAGALICWNDGAEHGTAGEFSLGEELVEETAFTPRRASGADCASSPDELTSRM
jgi:hypothetical protein